MATVTPLKTQVNLTRVFVGFDSRNFKSRNRAANIQIYDVDLVTRDLLLQFNTRQGQRVMLPTFGTIIYDLQFEGNTTTNIDAIKNDAIRICQSDPRVSVTNVLVDQYEYGVIVNISLNYVNFNQASVLSIMFDNEAATRI
jgi:phage baseplate assembly protein W